MQNHCYPKQQTRHEANTVLLAHGHECDVKQTNCFPRPLGGEGSGVRGSQCLPAGD